MVCFSSSGEYGQFWKTSLEFTEQSKHTGGKISPRIKEALCQDQSKKHEEAQQNELKSSFFFSDPENILKNRITSGGVKGRPLYDEGRQKKKKQQQVGFQFGFQRIKQADARNMMKYISQRHTILAENQYRVFGNEHYSLTVMTKTLNFSAQK